MVACETRLVACDTKTARGKRTAAGSRARPLTVRAASVHPVATCTPAFRPTASVLKVEGTTTKMNDHDENSLMMNVRPLVRSVRTARCPDRTDGSPQ
jgi:hypothetical protein